MASTTPQPAPATTPEGAPATGTVARGAAAIPGAPRIAPRIALDAMGGDHAPDAVVQGAVTAAGEGIDVVLVGVPDQVAAALERAGGADLPVVAAGEVVGMDEEPALALRTKPDASVRVAAALVAAGEADAFVSAGSTGATLASALLTLGRIEGVRRPVVAAVLPPRGVLVDAGGTPDVQPDALVTYARMGKAYAQVLGVSQPRVGLLNVGEERGKGHALARAAFDLLDGLDGFVGNVEPQGVLSGAVDVVVTDGFTGNVFLKTVEALSGQPDEQGAAVVLGVKGEVLVAHGAAGPAEVAAALRMAATVAAGRLSQRVAQRLAEG